MVENEITHFVGRLITALAGISVTAEVSGLLRRELYPELVHIVCEYGGDPVEVRDAFAALGDVTIVEYTLAEENYYEYRVNGLVRLANVDVNVILIGAIDGSFGATQWWYTGGPTERARLVELAEQVGYTLVPRGLFDGAVDDENELATEEDDIYTELGLSPTPPSERQ